MQSALRFVSSYFLLALLFASIATVTSDQCTDLYEKFANRTIYLTGLLKSRLFIITKDMPQLVYDVPANKVMPYSIDLYQVKPESVEVKWPTIYKDSEYQNIAYIAYIGNLMQTPTTIESDNEIMVFFHGYTLGPPPNYVNACLCTFEPDSIIHKLYECDRGDDSLYFGTPIFTSSIETNVFFSISLRDYIRHIYKYQYNQNMITLLWKVNLCIRTADNGSDILQFKEYGSDCALCPRYNWTVRNAFTHQGQFYLFGTDQVYIFPYVEENIVGTESVVTKVAFSDYFRCNPPTTIPVSPSTLSTHSTHSTLSTLSTLSTMSKPSTEPPTNETSTEIISSLDALSISEIILAPTLVVVLLGICICSVLTSEDETQWLPIKKGSSPADRVYGPKPSSKLSSILKERLNIGTE